MIYNIVLVLLLLICVGTMVAYMYERKYVSELLRQIEDLNIKYQHTLDEKND
jgi:hypothetical protein